MITSHRIISLLEEATHPHDLDDALLKAIQKEDEKEIKTLVEQGANINGSKYASDEDLPLAAALDTRSLPIISLCLSLGVKDYRVLDGVEQEIKDHGEGYWKITHDLLLLVDAIDAAKDVSPKIKSKAKKLWSLIPFQEQRKIRADMESFRLRHEAGDLDDDPEEMDDEDLYNTLYDALLDRDETKVKELLGLGLDINGPEHDEFIYWMFETMVPLSVVVFALEMGAVTSWYTDGNIESELKKNPRRYEGDSKAIRMLRMLMKAIEKAKKVNPKLKKQVLSCWKMLPDDIKRDKGSRY